MRTPVAPCNTTKRGGGATMQQQSCVTSGANGHDHGGGLDAAIAGFGGTDLFRLYNVHDAKSLQNYLATCHIWRRIFPFCARWLRLGLPPNEAAWSHVAAALAGLP